ncbi:MAG: TraB/GumN family protein [Nanobdellota archaeon]
MIEEQKYLIIGTSHIAKSSLEEIKQEFLSFRPDTIAVELDTKRAQALLSPQQQRPSARQLIKAVGLKGFLFTVIARSVQKRLGKMVGVEPGSEMKYAMELAKNNHLDIKLIDRSLEVTVRRLFKKLTWREKFRFIGQLVAAPFTPKKKRMKLPLDKVPPEQMIERLMKILKKQFPTMHEVLVEERNHYMARRAARYLKLNPEKKLMIVVGAGHKVELGELIPLYYSRMEVLRK